MIYTNVLNKFQIETSSQYINWSKQIQVFLNLKLVKFCPNFEPEHIASKKGKLSTVYSLPLIDAHTLKRVAPASNMLINFVKWYLGFCNALVQGSYRPEHHLIFSSVVLLIAVCFERLQGPLTWIVVIFNCNKQASASIHSIHMEYEK